MPRFRSSSKGPKEVVSELRETLLYLSHPAGSAQTNEGKRPKKHKSRGGSRKHEHSDADLTKAAGEECAALLTSLKSILFPDGAATIDKSQLDEVVKQCYDTEVLLYLVRASVLEELPMPEARRDVVRIFRYFLERQTDNTIKYIIKNQALISNLISGYESGKPQVVANCGLMLRACSRYKSLVWVILLLKSDDVLQFFDFMQSKQFEVLSDAFVTFKELLRHDDLTAKFLEENHEEVFQRLSEVLSSDFYISKHVCLEWLQELLSESNSIREYYYSSAANLKIAMTLLGSDPSVTIRFKALDLMQGFLTITEKEREVREILLMNREKLNGLVMELLTKFDKDEKHCPEPGRKFLLKTLEDPELTPALSELELVPVESHIHDGAVTQTEESVHDHQPNPPQDPTSEHVQPPVETIDSQNESEPPTQDEEQSHDQLQEPDQQPLVHDPTKDEEEEEHTPDDEQSREQEQLNEPHQQDELEIEERLADQPVEEQLQAEKSNEDGESGEKPDENQEDDEPERKEPVSVGQPDEAEQLQPSKDSDPEEQPKESHEDDTEQPDSAEHLVDLSYKDQLQVESPSKDSELEEKLNDHRDDSDHPESKDLEHSVTDQPNEEQLQTGESKNKDADQPETDGPLPTHSEIELEKEEQPFIDHKQPFEQQFNPSYQPEIEVILVKQSNGTEVEEALILLHSEYKESQDEAPPDHQHEGEEERLPDQQKNEELSPGFLLSNGEELLPDQPSERETTSFDYTEDPAGSLPDDVEDPLPNQINGDDDEQESLPDQPSENDTTLPDHKEDPPEEPLLAETEDMLPQQNEDEPKIRDLLTENEEGTLLDHIESMEKQPDHKEDPLEEPLLADIEDTLPQQNEDEPKNRDSLTENEEGMLLDRIESMEKQPDHKEDPPEEPLLADTEDTLPQQNEDEPKNRDSLTENEGMLLDRIESMEKLPEIKELPQNEEYKEALPDKLDDEPDHSDKVHENEGTLPEEQLFDFNFSEMPTLESSQVQPLAVETVEEHLPKLLEELENVLTNNQPDTAQLQQQFHDFTKPDFDRNQVQEQQEELDDAATTPELPSETQAAEQLVQDSTMTPDHSDEIWGQNDDSTKPDCPPDEAQIEQQLDDSTTKPVEMQEHQFDQDTTALSHHPDESQEPPSPESDKRLETPDEPLVMIEPTEEGETPKQQLPMEEPAAQQEEHQPQPLPGKQDCTDESSEQESQLPQHDYDYHSQPVQSEDQAFKEPSELEEEPSTEQEHPSESELPMETREILVD